MFSDYTESTIGAAYYVLRKKYFYDKNKNNVSNVSNVSNEPNEPNASNEMEMNDHYTQGKSMIEYKLTYQIWDTSGQERYRSLCPMYYRDADVVLICYDIANSISFKSVDYWIKELNKTTYKLKSPLIYIIGNKKDLIKNEINLLDINYVSYPIYEVSAKTGENIKKLFDDISHDICKVYNHEYIPTLNTDTVQLSESINKLCCTIN